MARLRWFCPFLVTLLLSAPATAGQPADGWLAAWRDAQSLGGDCKHVRWLWFLEDEPKLKQIGYLIVASHLNRLSRYPKISRPAIVMRDGTTRLWPDIKPEEWGSATLVRVTVTDYWPDASVWDRLGDPRLEPYFHVSTVVPYPAGYYTNGKSYPAGEEKVDAIAPWLLSPLGADDEAKAKCREAVFGLIKATDYSPCPVVEVRNFVWQTAIQFDRKAGYYDWLGVKDRKTFQALVGFDEKASLAFAYPRLEAVAESGVAAQPRRIEVWEKIGGRYILTKDQVNQRGQGKRNPLVALDLDELVFDAEEIFASLPNGMWATGLFDKDGKRQDSAPDGVGYLHQSLGNDGKIHVNLACIVCHDRKAGNGGLQPIPAYFRNLFAVPGPIGLVDKDPEKQKRLEQYYLSKLDFDPDRRRYVEALFECNGLLPHQDATYLYEVFHEYDKPVGFDQACREFGVTEAELVKAFGAGLRFFGKVDFVNGNWILAKERRRRIGRDQFAEAYNLGQLGLRGLPTWPAEYRSKWPVKR